MPLQITKRRYDISSLLRLGLGLELGLGLGLELGLRLEATKYPRIYISSLRYLERHNILGYFAAGTKYPSVKISCGTGLPNTHLPHATSSLAPSSVIAEAPERVSPVTG